MTKLKLFLLLLCAAMSSLALAQIEVVDAAMQGDSDKVERLLEAGADVNVVQADGATSLHWAAYHGDAHLAEILLNAGANVNVANRNGSTPMWLAAKQGNADIINLLLMNGGDANEALPLGRSPLMLAARSGQVDAMQVLLSFGAEANASESDRGTTALMQAADQGHAGAMQVLIEHGADVSAVSSAIMRDGRTAALGNSTDPRNQVRRQVIAILCEEDVSQLDMMHKLIQESKDDPALASLAMSEVPLSKEDICSKFQFVNMGFVIVDGQNDIYPQRTADGGELTPLLYAARSGVISAAQVLLDAGADINQLSAYGWSPLLVATQNRNYKMAKFLIEHGADINIANNGGWTNLYLATDNRNVEGGDYPTREPDMDDLEYIHFLLDAGAEPNARLIESTETRTVFTNQWLDESGATAFLRASQSGDVALMKLLLEYDADPHINTSLDVTPLSVAAGIGWVEGVTRERSTAQTIEAVKLLLSLGIDANFQADTGRTALHGAAHKGATQVVQILIEAGARLDIRDFGNTDNRGSSELAAHTWLAIDYADGLVRVGVQSSIPHPETAQLLRNRMIDEGLETPPIGRTLESICIVDVCSADYNPLEYN